MAKYCLRHKAALQSDKQRAKYQFPFKHCSLATLGLAGTWMGDCLGASNAAGMGSNTDVKERINW